MTNKNAAAGERAGREQGEGTINQDFCRTCSPERARELANEWARKESKSTIFAEAYESAFMRVYFSRRDELPEVQAANRKLRIERAIETLASGAEAALDKFKVNLAENPRYAFEWSDNAMESAVRMDVARRLTEVLTHEKGGHEAAATEARKQALRGARWPSHSTSAITNMVKELETAAYAEVASQIEDRS